MPNIISDLEAAAMIDYAEIEPKWQRAWSEAKLFEAEPNDKQAIMVFAAEPYINAPLHIGHLRTYGTADMYARYMRMRNYNVLYPMAMHATGTPVLAFAKRLQNNDRELAEELRQFHIDDADIEKMKDPKYIIEYFIPQMEKLMSMSGFSIDWRREFISIEPLFSKMIEWQFARLNDKGLLVKGKHPVGWCPNDKNAVGQHDTKHDVQPEIEQLTVVKFKDEKEDIFFPCSTYRPETIYGVTNIFIGEKIQYVVANINGQRYYLSKDAAQQLAQQMDIKQEAEISVSEMLAKNAVNPINMEIIPVLPGFFVKSDIGTGIVMSVPSHAPFDYAALERLKASGYPMPKMEYRKLIDIEPTQAGHTIGRSIADVPAGEAKPLHPEIPALAYLEVLHTDPNAIDDMLEFATKLIYREESHWGRMAVGKYAGKKESEAREAVKRDLLAAGDALEIYAISNPEPVICRCGTRVTVKIVDDQWFIDYGNAKWKDAVRSHFADTKIYPASQRRAFEYTIDWLNGRAAERAQGFGTKFPLNPNHIIESLSDSTIYMAFFTFVHILRANKITPDQLKPEFFDYVTNGIGEPSKVSEVTAIDQMVLKKCRESFNYWYAYTSSHSGPDLIQNHLTMYLFNNVTIFNDKRMWPKQIVVNGMLNYEGQKMSKSLGNIVPLIDGIKKYGVDPMRALIVCGAELDTESEFSTTGINSITSRNEYLHDVVTSLPTMRTSELRHIDYWLYSKLNSKIKAATAHMDKLELRSAQTLVYYDSVAELRHYLERGNPNSMVLREFIEDIVLMLSPSMPHITEEFWHELGHDTLIASEQWPRANQSMINAAAEMSEQIIEETTADILNAMWLTARIEANKGKKLDKITIILAGQWKLAAYNLLAQAKDIKKIMESDELKEVDKQKLSKFVAQFSKSMQSLKPIDNIDNAYLINAFNEAKPYMEKKFDASLIIENESESSSPRASRALPSKPCIDLHWQ